MKKFVYPALIAAIGFIGFTSCDKNDDESPVLSSDAAIESFTFNTFEGENSIVTSQPIIRGTSISFTVDGMADNFDIAALHPTIVVSEGATYSFSGSFETGMNYVVTAEDGKTKNSYTATCTGSMFDVYSGTLDVSLPEISLVKDAPYNISLEKESETTVRVYISDFTIDIESMNATIPLGEVEIGGCTVTKTDNGYVFNGTKDLGTIDVPIFGQIIPAHCVVNVENASVVDGTFTLPMKIDVLDGVLTVDANFVGTPMEE